MRLVKLENGKYYEVQRGGINACRPCCFDVVRANCPLVGIDRKVCVAIDMMGERELGRAGPAESYLVEIDPLHADLLIASGDAEIITQEELDE